MAILSAAPLTEDAACDATWLLGFGTPAAVIAAPPAATRDAVDFVFTSIRRNFEELATPIEVFEARFTGDFPAIAAGPSYDVSGLEPERGVRLSLEDALRVGRSLQRLVSAELEDIDIDY